MSLDVWPHLSFRIQQEMNLGIQLEPQSMEFSAGMNRTPIPVPTDAQFACCSRGKLAEIRSA